MSEWLHSLVQQVVLFAGANPTSVGLILCAAAAGEAILIVGAILPGEAVILALAAAAGAAGLALTPMILWTTLGAVSGDGLSYWIGHSKGEAIANWSYLRKRPYLLESGEEFISGHGIKSIVIARFLPALRAIVPLAAGVLKMEPKRFFVANIISAIVWAIVHVLPAAGLGLAFTTLGAVSGRLAILVGFALIALVGLFWMTKLVVTRAMPLLARGYANAVEALSRLPWAPLKRVALWLDPNDPKLPGVALWSGILLAATVGFMGVLEDLISGDPLVRADTAINRLVQSLRSEPMDQVMVMITSFGDALPLIAGAGVLIVLLVLQRAWRTAAAVTLTIASAAAFVPMMKLILHKPRPIEIYSGAESYSFPSGHTTMSAVLWGVFAVLITRALPARAKIAIYVAAGLWVTSVGASRIYLSAHWPSDVLGGLLFGAALTAAFALLIEHIDVKSYSRSLLAAGVLAAFAFVGATHAYHSFDKNRQRYAQRIAIKQVNLADWQNRGWHSLPETRIDLGGEREEPFIMQWAGSPARLTGQLEKAGWHKTRAFTWRDALELLLPNAALADLAPLPLLHNGRLAVASYSRAASNSPDKSTNARLVLRFWRSTTIVSRNKGGAPVLLGSLRREQLTHPLHLASTLRQRNVSTAAKSRLLGRLQKRGKINAVNTAPPGPLLSWPKD